MTGDPETLIGRRFGTDLRVVAITPGDPADDTRTVTVHMQGDAYAISLGELRTLIERGFISELPEGRRSC